MTITYPLSVPTSPKPRKSRLLLRSKVGTAESTFTFSTQKQDHACQRWEIDYELPPMTASQAGAWIAFMCSLNGAKGTALVPEPDRTAALGVATGTPIVDGGSQTGNVLLTKGWTGNTAGILLAGDYIQVGSYMYMVLKTVASETGGSASLDIMPALRSSPTASASITTSNVKTLMRLSTNEMAWSTDELKHYGLSMSFIEELPS